MKFKLFAFFVLYFLICQIVLAQTDRGVKNIKVEQKIALVIGNTNYDNSIGRLTNPVNDADDMAESLKRLGFTLVGGKPQLDLNRKQMLALIRDFGQQIKAGGIGFFYFSGHGVQVNKENYIIPITDALVYEDDAETEAVKVDMVAKEMELAGNRLNILVLDACRNNGLQKRTRNTDKGLTEPNRKPEGTFIAFSAGDGQTASDGRGKNGLFTQELLKNLETPNVRLDDIFRTTRNEVKRLSDGRQVPILYDSTSEAFILKVIENYSENKKDRSDYERKFWDSIENSRNAQDFENYLLRIRKGEFTGMFKATAELKLSRLKKNAEPQPPTEQDENVKNDFAAITGGTFMMGTGALQRTVSNFYIAKYKVTQAQWQSITGLNPSYLKGCNQCPVENISWNQVQDFLKTLNAKRDGWGYRLPTEIEWEYVARAGSALNSVQDLDANAWYKNNSGGKTNPVGEKKANKWGIFDVYGNVMEWVADDSDQTGDNTLHIVRGCSFADESGKCTPARREKLPRDSQRSTIGFRLVKYSLPFPTGKRKE